MRATARRIARAFGGGYAVVERDFLVLTSTGRFLALRFAVALVAAVVVAVTAFSNLDSGPDAISRVVLGAATIVMPLLVLLLAPSLAAPAISSERDGGTLDLVLAAPVGATSLVLAKFASRMMSIAVLVFAMLPVAAVGSLYGGVAPETFLALIAFTLSTGVFCVATGLLFSAYLRSVSAAVLGSLLFVLLAPLAPLVLLAVLTDGAVFRSMPLVEDLILPFQTFYAWSELAEAAFRGRYPAPVCWEYAWRITAVSAVLLLLATQRMRREGQVSPRRRRRRAYRGLFWGRPLLDRGVRGTLLWHPTLKGLVVPALAVIGDGVLVIVAANERALDEPWVHMSALGSLTLLAMLQTLSNTSSALATERKRGSLDVLMATPFSPAQVVRGVLFGAQLATAPLYVLGIAHGALAAFFGFLQPATVVWWLLSAAVLTTAVGCLGTVSSARAGSPTKGSLLAFGLLFGGCVGVLLIVLMIGVTRGSDQVAQILVCSLPPVEAYYGMVLIDDTFERGYIRTRYRDFADLAPLVVLLLYVPVSYVLHRLAVRFLESSRD